MLKKIFFILILFHLSGLLQAQENNSLYKTKKILVTKDTIRFENQSINPTYFKLFKPDDTAVEKSDYIVNFTKGYLILNPSFFKPKTDYLTLHYLKYPDFLTKNYKVYDLASVVSNDASTASLYKIDNTVQKKNLPFDGLSTSGSITRGVTVGNNQNTVLNSNLDLQITGKLSDKLSLRASLHDSNIPLQNGGYSQKLDQFDNIFMELFSEKWNVRAGDVFLENRKTQFLQFNKKVQGLATQIDLGTETNKTTVFASAALVRGQYAKSDFTGVEGNQGPYKLRGQNGELFVLVISGSERVYINGRLLKRGENNDYTIDYNAGEITFTSLFTITSEMRIAVEYQFSDRNYTRFVTYAGTEHTAAKWRLNGYLYSENDLKNQPLQQSLSPEQVKILSNAGNDSSKMIAQSAFLDTYDENKILYAKRTINGFSFFEISTNSMEPLYTVSFTFVGTNKGNYKQINAFSVQKTFEYTAPINNIPSGDYEPIVQLIAPTKIQVATVLGAYNPSEKTNVDFEIALSNNDKNLFSTLDDDTNQGLSGKINAQKRLFSKKWEIDAFGQYQFTQKNFRSVERLNTIEFNRDWNIEGILAGNQSLLVSGLKFNLSPKHNPKQFGNFSYQFEKLNSADVFTGNKHQLFGLFKINNWNINTKTSSLASQGQLNKTTFIRNQTQLRYHFKKNWIGATNRLEDNQFQNKFTNTLSNLSQRFTEYGSFVGRGDSTKVYIELGLLKRNNDSIQNGLLQRVNNSNAYYLKSKLIETSKSDLSIYTNYRVLNFYNATQKKESTLNSRVIFNNRYFNQLIQTSSTYETNSGSIPQQEFTFVEVPDGQGVYRWNDYNNNGIKEIQEFEIAPFIDQAKYIQVFLPNLVYLKTQQVKFSQSLIFNPNQWQNKTGFQKWASYFYNQTTFLIDRKMRNEGDNFNLNPFGNTQQNIVGLNSSIRNTLFLNRGKQKHSVSYTYLENKAKNLLSNGSQETNNNSHQLQYTHLYNKSWLLNTLAKTVTTALATEKFIEKNYSISGYQIAPKLSYLFSKNMSWDVFYELQRKENKTGANESLVQNRFGSTLSYLGSKNVTLNAEFSLYQNTFTGVETSAAGFQMLEGLQSGQNTVWKILLQKNINQFLDININYLGRKTETSQAIHTGNIQLRAYF